MKEKKKKNTFAKNVLMLMFSQVLIKLLGLIYRLAITNVKGFGDVGNGYYSAGYQVYAVLLIISSQGIPGAVSKLVSNKVAKGKYNEAHRVFKVSMVVFGIIGFIASLLLLLSANFCIIKNIKCSRCILCIKSFISSNILCMCISSYKRLFCRTWNNESIKYFTSTRTIL